MTERSQYPALPSVESIRALSYDPRWMRGARERFTALLICLVFASLELLSAAPGMHRHDGGPEVFLRVGGAGVAAIGAAGSIAPAGTSVAAPASPGDQAPRECPACRLSGLFAVASCGIPTSVPATQASPRIAAGSRAFASPVVDSIRGRAPPLA